MPLLRGSHRALHGLFNARSLFRVSGRCLEDYYLELGISRTASHDEVKKAYRKAAMEHHPDRFPDPDKKKTAEEKFKKVASAYTVLSDRDKRARYDRFGAAGVDGGGGAGYSSSTVDPEEVFASPHHSQQRAQASHYGSYGAGAAHSSPFGEAYGYAGPNVFAWAEGQFNSHHGGGDYASEYEQFLRHAATHGVDPSRPFGEGGGPFAYSFDGGAPFAEGEFGGMYGMPRPGSAEYDSWMADGGAAGEDPYIHFMREVFEGDKQEQRRRVRRSKAYRDYERDMAEKWRQFVVWRSGEFGGRGSEYEDDDEEAEDAFARFVEREARRGGRPSSDRRRPSRDREERRASQSAHSGPRGDSSGDEATSHEYRRSRSTPHVDSDGYVTNDRSSPRSGSSRQRPSAQNLSRILSEFWEELEPKDGPRSSTRDRRRPSVAEGIRGRQRPSGRRSASRPAPHSSSERVSEAPPSTSPSDSAPTSSTPTSRPFGRSTPGSSGASAASSESSSTAKPPPPPRGRASHSAKPRVFASDFGDSCDGSGDRDNVNGSSEDAATRYWRAASRQKAKPSRRVVETPLNTAFVDCDPSEGRRGSAESAFYDLHGMPRMKGDPRRTRGGGYARGGGGGGGGRTDTSRSFSARAMPFDGPCGGRGGGPRDGSAPRRGRAPQLNQSAFHAPRYF